MHTNRTMITATVAAGLIGAAFMGAVLPASAAAQSVKPIQYQSINLGHVAGDVYYTVRPDGFHVIATFAQRGENATPVRFQAVLANGQTVTFSTPREVGVPPDAVEVVRQNDKVYVHKSSLVD